MNKKDETIDVISFLIFTLFYLAIVFTNFGKPVSLLALGMYASYMMSIRKKLK